MSTAIHAQTAKENWKQLFAKVSDEYLDQVLPALSAQRLVRRSAIISTILSLRITRART